MTGPVFSLFELNTNLKSRFVGFVVKQWNIGLTFIIYTHKHTHTHTHTYIYIYIYIQIFLYFFFFRDSQFFRLFLYFRFWNKNFKKIGCAIAQQSIVKNSDSSSRLQMFFKTNDLEKFCNIHKKTPLSEYLFNKVALKLFIKKRLQHSNTCIFLWILQNF